MEGNKGTCTGRIHSLESFGTVDGPGIRFVVFFQGCPMRCQYCHNPDTWEPQRGQEMSVDEILSSFERNKHFYKNGGITATGGEPLMQLDFLTALFSEAKKRGIHTCLDTSGIMYREEQKEKYEKLFAVLDLVLLDIKHSDLEEHKKLTRQPMEPILKFARALEAHKIPMLVRHVAVPGITDGKEHLENLGKLLAGFRNLKGLDVLPYHTMGEKKYEGLGIEYPLKGIEAMPKEDAKKAREIILMAFKKERQKNK